MTHHISINRNTGSHWSTDFFFHTHISLFRARNKCKQVDYGPKFLFCQKTISWEYLWLLYNSSTSGAVVIKNYPRFYSPSSYASLLYFVSFLGAVLLNGISASNAEWNLNQPLKSVDKHGKDCQLLVELRCVGQAKTMIQNVCVQMGMTGALVFFVWILVLCVFKE